MFLWTALLYLFSANLVASQFFLPEVFATYNPRTILKPFKNGLKSGGSSDNVRVIRALLAVRQAECPANTAECINVPGRLVLQFASFFSSSSYSTRALVVVICSPVRCNGRILWRGMLTIGVIPHSCCPPGNNCCPPAGKLTRDPPGPSTCPWPVSLTCMNNE